MRGGGRWDGTGRDGTGREGGKGQEALHILYNRQSLSIACKTVLVVACGFVSLVAVCVDFVENHIRSAVD